MKSLLWRMGFIYSPTIEWASWWQFTPWFWQSLQERAYSDGYSFGFKNGLKAAGLQLNFQQADRHYDA